MPVPSRSVAAFLLVLLVPMAGCVGVLTGNEPLAVQSDPVSVSPAARNDAGPLGSGEVDRFVVATPAVVALGQTFNPVGDTSKRELAEMVKSQYRGLENRQSAGERRMSVLGTEAMVSRFNADAAVGTQIGPSW